MISSIYKLCIPCACFTVSAFAQGDICRDVEKKRPDSRIQQLPLDEKFKNFLSQDISSTAIDPNSVKIKYLLPPNSGKNFVGLVFEFNKNSGKLFSIEPLFEIKEDENENFILWAFDRFYDGKICFDSLWDVVASSAGQAIDRKQIFQILANGLSTYKDRNSILIYENGPVSEAVAKIKKDEFVKNNRLALIDLMRSIIK